MLRTLAWPGERHRSHRVQARVAEYREFQDGELISGTRYRVVGLVGVGGMGTVYEVEHVELGKRFVLKALLRELSRRQDLVIRLRNEWRALGRLEHPNIVTVTDAGTSENGVPFFVMERLEGETLSQKMRRTRRFPVREAVDIAAGVLEGLAAAHQISVVHRDVKPPNIFVLADGRPKVLDFGVAKIVDDPGVVTARGVAVGTPRYMSPEQARGETVDGRADIYSVGLILFETIAGVSPFDDARDANELILAHLASRPPPLSSLAMGVPGELDALVANMLAKRREDRPPTALEAARRLREISVASARGSRTPPPYVLANQPGSSTPVPQVDTTRPDGVASRPRATGTSITSTEALSLLEKPTLRQLPPGDTSTSVEWSRTAADTLIGLPPSDATLTSSVTAQPCPDGRVSTEILTAVPAPEPDVTRTSYPSRKPATISETPPPVTPSKELRAEPVPVSRSGGGGSVWLALGLLALTVVVAFVLVGRSLQQEPGRAPAAATAVASTFAPVANTARAASGFSAPPAAAPAAGNSEASAPRTAALHEPAVASTAAALRPSAKNRHKMRGDAASTAAPEARSRPPGGASARPSAEKEPEPASAKSRQVVLPGSGL